METTPKNNLELKKGNSPDGATFKNFLDYLNNARQQSREQEIYWNIVREKGKGLWSAIIGNRSDLVEKFTVGRDKQYRDTRAAAHDLIELLAKETEEKISREEEEKETQSRENLLDVLNKLRQLHREQEVYRHVFSIGDASPILPASLINRKDLIERFAVGRGDGPYRDTGTAAHDLIEYLTKETAKRPDKKEGGEKPAEGPKAREEKVEESQKESTETPGRKTEIIEEGKEEKEGPEAGLDVEDLVKKRIQEALKQKGVVVNVEELAEAETHKAADARMTEEKGRSGFFRKLWKHTYFDEYYRQKEANRARRAIKGSKNIYAGRGLDKAAHENAMRAVIERFASEYEGAISQGEERKTAEASDPVLEKAKQEIKRLILDYGKGAIDEEIFTNEKNRVLDGLSGDTKKRNQALYADNLFELAKNARLAVEHGLKLEELDFDFDLIIGKAKSSLKTEAHLTGVDKVIDRLKKTKVGRLVSPAVLATSVGIAYCASINTFKIFSRSRVLQYATLGGAAVLAGTFAGLNERQRLERERAQHALERAEGGAYEAGSKRREEMERYQYETRSARDLIEQLHNIVSKEIKTEDLPQVFSILGDIETRTSLNDSRKIDLISYSSLANVEKERTELTILLARAKVELRKKLENELKDGIPQGETFDSYLEKQTESTTEALLGGEKGITAQDKAFRVLKRRRVAKKFGAAVLSGLVIGGVAQEVRALLSDQVQGAVEGMLGSAKPGATTTTPLEHLREWITGHPSHLGMGNAVEQQFDNGTFRLPEGASMIQNADGTFNIMHGDRMVSDHVPLSFGANGELTPESVARLGEDGIIANTTHAAVNTTAETIENAQSYINDHPENTQHIARDLWYDNDTPKPVFDKNELKLWWGGEGNVGMDVNGNYVLNVSHMTSGGSFHESFSADAQEKIKNGGLKLLLSLSQGTQHQVFEVPIDIHGNAVIDPSSEIGKLFFGQEGGRGIFKGRFAEVAETFGEREGVEHVRILSTLEGPGNETIKDIIPVPTDVPIHNLDVPLDHEPPWFIPVPYRRPLEPIKTPPVPPYYYFGSSGSTPMTKEQRESYEKERSKTLKENPGATLDQYTEIKNYLEKQDRAYTRELEELIKDVEPMGEKTRLTICIPAAGHQEGESIYKTLENFTNQTIDKEKFEIVLFVNMPEEDEKGRKVKPDKTLKEILRFKKKHPEMNVRVLQKTIPFERAKIGYARKVLHDAVLLRQLRRGETSPELIMVSNDADNKGISPEYVDNFISKFDSNKNVDAMTGQIDWDIASYVRNPLIHIGTRLFQYQGVQARLRGWHFNSPGASFAMRASSYAAVGGYNEGLNGGEDTDLGKKIESAREGAKEKIPIGYAGARASRLFTSSRRAERAAAKGLAPIEQWDDGFSAFDDEVRKVNWENKSTKINYRDKKQVKKLVDALETVINRTIQKTKIWNGSAEDPLMRRSLGWLGIKYEITGSHSIKITDASKLIAGLAQYQTEGLKILERKTKRKKKVAK